MVNFVNFMLGCAKPCCLVIGSSQSVLLRSRRFVQRCVCVRIRWRNQSLRCCCLAHAVWCSVGLGCRCYCWRWVGGQNLYFWYLNQEEARYFHTLNFALNVLIRPFWCELKQSLEVNPAESWFSVHFYPCSWLKIFAALTTGNSQTQFIRIRLGYRSWWWIYLTSSCCSSLSSSLHSSFRFSSTSSISMTSWTSSRLLTLRICCLTFETYARISISMMQHLIWETSVIS